MMLPERLGDLTGLKKLNLEGCCGLEGLPERLGDLTGIKKLILRGCSGLMLLPERLGDLRELKKLDLGGCNGLTELPERLTKLIWLRELNLGGCISRLGLAGPPANRGLPQWLEDLAHDYMSAGDYDMSECTCDSSADANDYSSDGE